MSKYNIGVYRNNKLIGLEYGVKWAKISPANCIPEAIYCIEIKEKDYAPLYTSKKQAYERIKYLNSNDLLVIPLFRTQFLYNSREKFEGDCELRILKTSEIQ
jgi:hypothetical protein